MQWTKNQTKKMMYVLAGLFVSAMIVVISVFMWSDSLPVWIQEKKEIIVSSVLTYGSGALLLTKIMTFVVGEIVKKRYSSKEKIEQFLIKEIAEKPQENKGEKEMKKCITNEQKTSISNVYHIGNYKFILNEKKGIHISWEGEFNYQEFKYANGEFVEKIRKIVELDR